MEGRNLKSEVIKGRSHKAEKFITPKIKAQYKKAELFGQIFGLMSFQPYEFFGRMIFSLS